MLRLESYLSPFLLSYLSKYIKDIEAKNLQLSLWGGDVILHNLQFKLDALDNELGRAPFSFVSCEAKELRIHVPWSKLTSESVVITLNTVECVVKLNCQKTLYKTDPVTKDDASTEPSYINSLLKKVKSNLTLNINNLIMKYIEDDIVLSINLQSAIYQTVDHLWKPAFVDLTEDDPVLRRLLELTDMTVCLDKRGTSGGIESFENPMLFRTHFVFREHNVYATPGSRKPLATKFNMLVDRYELNISENQLPMFLHLVQLCLHLYYSTIDVSITECENSCNSDTPERQGWTSWAWSYVPPVLSYEIEEIEMHVPIFAFGMYLKYIVVRFTPSRQNSAKQFHTSQFQKAKAFLEITAEGFQLELVLKGLEFFSCVSSLCNFAVKFLGGLPKLIHSETVLNTKDENNILLAAGGGNLSNFAALSLFDFRSPENNDTLFEYPLTKEAFFNEKNLHETDVFYSQYLYIATDGRSQSDDNIEFNDYLKHAKLTNVGEWDNINEQSWKKFFMGGDMTKIFCSSHALICVDVLNSWTNNHNIKPYPLAPSKAIVTPDILKDVSFIPTRTSTIIFKNLNITFVTLCLDTKTYSPKTFWTVNYAKKPTCTTENKPLLPAATIAIPICEVNIVQPMYATHFAAYLAKYISPFPSLLQTCNVQYSLQVPSIKVFLWYKSLLASENNVLPLSLKPIVTVEQFSIQVDRLQGEQYWKERGTMFHTQKKMIMQKIYVSATVKQLEFTAHIIDSWISLTQKNVECSSVLDVSNMTGIFEDINLLPILYIKINNLVLENNISFATSLSGGAISNCQMYWMTSDGIIPVLQFCNAVQQISSPEDFLKPVNCKLANFQQSETFVWSDATHAITFYLQMSDTSDEKGCLLISIHKLFLNIDPFMIDILCCVPSIIPFRLVPFLTSLLSSKTNSSENKLAPMMEEKLLYALQFQCFGGQLFMPVKSHPCSLEKFEIYPAVYIVQESIIESKTSTLVFCFPSISAFTSGFKSVTISSKLLSKELMINKFTECSTVDFGFEQASFYSVCCSDDRRLNASNLIKPCNATCTLVFKQAKNSKYNLALHVDLESIFVECSKNQTSLLVQVINPILHVITSINKNCSLELPTSIFSEQVQSEATDPTCTKTEKEVPSSASHIVPTVSLNRNLLITLWMQCTLPRFMVTIHCDEKHQVSLFVDDVSLSLDYQSIYLKLLISLSTCNITYWKIIDKNWEKSYFRGLLFSPMFSLLPSFVQKFNIVSEKVETFKSEVSSKPGKFLDLTFTQALTSDYKKNIQEVDFDQASSSAVSTNTDLVNFSNATISEIICTIQSFDIVLNLEPLLGIINVFVPLLQLEAKSLYAKKITAPVPPLNLPVLFVTVIGARLFLPLETPHNIADDDIIMLCFGKMNINPHPQNPLSRLVVSSKIYKDAIAAGLLSSPGSSLEDKQFEITLQDLNFGTTKSSNVIFHIKKGTLHARNPALQWNMFGKTVLEDPIFHPLVQQVDIKVLIAPSLYCFKSGRYLLVCGPSLEVNFMTPLVLHVTTMQLSLVVNVINAWLSQIQNISKVLSEFKSESLPDFPNKQEKNILTSVKNSRCSSKLIKKSIEHLLSDNLITGQKLHLFVYDYATDGEVKPLLQFKVDEPSFVFHVSHKEQKVVLQFHNAFASVGAAEAKNVVMIQEEVNFPITFIETQQGEYNKRTGVPISLCTATVDRFLCKRSAVKLCIGRPVKFYINESVIACIKQMLLAINILNNSPSVAAPSTSNNILINFSSFDLYTNQIVCEINHCSHILRNCISEINAHAEANVNGHLGTISIKDFSFRLAYDKEEFYPFLYPVTITADWKSNAFLTVRTCLSSVHFALSCNILNGIRTIISFMQIYFAAFNQPSVKPCNTVSSESILSENAEVIKSDDLRRGKYDYIFVESTEPLPGQIVFSQLLPVSTMAWCYEKPHTIRHVFVMPIPFNEVLGDGSDILCVLESFCEMTECYIAMKEFYISQTNHVDFILFDKDLPFHELIYATKWRVSVQNTEKCHVSPVSLAGSMMIEAVGGDFNLPKVVASFKLNSVKVTLNTNNFEKDMENAQFKLSNGSAWFKIWPSYRNCFKTFASFSVAMSIVEYHSLRWIPLLLPAPIKIKLLKTVNSTNCFFDIEEIAEIHFSQRIIYSLQNFMSNFSDLSSKDSFFLPIVIKNSTCKALSIGQALTNECIKLESGSKTSYTWQTNTLDLNLHVSIDNLSSYVWSQPFSPYISQSLLCEIDKFHSLVVLVDQLNSHSSSITFNGCTKVFNYLDVNLQVCFVVDGISIFTNCATDSCSDEGLLFLLKDVSTIQFSFNNVDDNASSVVFADELTASPESVKIIELNTPEKTVHAQVFCYKEELADAIAIMPIFIVRSYLPDLVTLHVETRSANAFVTVPLNGYGNQINLTSLSPFETHHLSLQPPENESPFDATIPIHFSLIQTLPNDAEVSVCKNDLVKFYPYNSANYESKPDNSWSVAEGKIQAKLSLCIKSLLVEIVPWCLVCNQTSMVFCITSTDRNVTIVQPELTTTLHHFTGPFNICLSNGSCSNWISLTLSPEFGHPSRAEQQRFNHLPCNGFLPVSLETATFLIEILLCSTVHHGLRVITICPKWKFINLSNNFESCGIFPCVDEQLCNFDSSDFIVNAIFSKPVPILCWQNEASNKLPKEIGYKDELASVSIGSTAEKTSSSFLCVDRIEPSSFQYDKILCIICDELVAIVSVKENFTKKLIAFHLVSDNILKKQMILTRHDFRDSNFLILSEIKKEKYVFQNYTDKVLHLREVVDDCFYNKTELILKPEEVANYESFMDTELFPKCTRKLCTVKLEICEKGINDWVELSIIAQDYSDEILLPDAQLLVLTVSYEHGQFVIRFLKLSETKQAPIAEQTYNFCLSSKEIKVVCLDDVSNNFASIDIIQLIFDDIDISVKQKQLNWLVELSLNNFQIDNQLYPRSDFPIFLTSVGEKAQKVLLSLNLCNNFTLNTVEIAFDTLELQCDDDYLQVLSKLLQSYIDLIHPSSKPLRKFLQLPETIENEVAVFCEPLRFQSLVIRPLTLFLSFRASRAVTVYIDRGNVTFSKFALKTLDTTFRELVQEIMRHYFAEAVYGAGWVIGSVDLLGNPATTVRSYIKGISDFIILPYRGLVNGPTAFIGGFARGVSSLLRHFSAGTLRSVTNIAGGISRNLDYSYKEQSSTEAFPSLILLPKSIKDKNLISSKKSSYVSGFAKTLVSVVTKPIGSAAKLLSITGETILRKVSLEDDKMVRYGSASHTTKSYQNSLTKYGLKLVADVSVSPFHLSALDCQMLCINGVAFTATLVLSSTTLYIFQLVDDRLETSIAIADINLNLEKSINPDSMLLNIIFNEPSEKNDDYSDKVANFLGVESPKKYSDLKLSKTVEYRAEVQQEADAVFFVNIFNVMKQKTVKFSW